MNNSKRIKGLVFFTMLMAITAFTWALGHKILNWQVIHRPEKAVYAQPVRKTPVYNQAILQKFATVCQVFNMQKPVFTCSGVINVTDGADSSKSIRNLTFTMCKKGSDCFYQFGHTVILNARGKYICIENDQKRVIVTEQKSFIDAPLPDMSQMAKNMAADYYNLTDSVAGKNETIAFVNERHITCKEYAITFDTLSKKANRVYARLTNFKAPERKDREKIIEITIAECDDTADVDKYVGRYTAIRQAGNSTKLTGKYTGYELINL
ncbi:hypothetical protein BEL04_18880 [Mucilaginibacter sp. PPCGB 2223]|nr:hypothetical protein BEL04_18880 [Mucilaginibacter sp. PPCGB 2223]